MKKLNWTNYKRYIGIKHNNGAIGCSLSHLNLLKYAKNNNLDYIIIFEDDIKFTDIGLFKYQFTKFINSKINWDVIILSGNNYHPFTKISDFCIKVKNSQSTLGYVVHKNYYNTLINNYKVGIDLLIKNQNKPYFYCIDIYRKILQQNDNWYMIIPATISQHTTFSNIEKTIYDCNELLLNYEKENISSLNLLQKLIKMQK